MTDLKFTFFAHTFRLNGPKANEDTDVVLPVDVSEREQLAPFNFIPPNTRLKIEVSLEE